jgi:opacity protein-like surface antigen
MRHNPGVVLDGFTYGTGANPGRIGGDVTVGAQYGLSEQWTLRGSYSFEAAENNRVHNVNVGAVYSF